MKTQCTPNGSAKATAANTRKILLVYEEMTEALRFYLIDATEAQRRVLKSINGAYINGDASDKQLTALDTQIMPALDSKYPAENPDPEWVGIWESCVVDHAKMPKLPACRIIVFGCLP